MTSTVHVPTNVYEKDSMIINDVVWSEKMDSVFQDNLDRDETLSWQYMCSETGPFRIFPGLLRVIVTGGQGGSGNQQGRPGRGVRGL